MFSLNVLYYSITNINEIPITTLWLPLPILLRHGLAITILISNAFTITFDKYVATIAFTLPISLQLLSLKLVIGYLPVPIFHYSITVSSMIYFFITSN